MYPARDPVRLDPPQRRVRPLPPGVAPLEDADPRTIGGHELVGRLGTGGMATVYLGDRDGLVAIKLIHPHLASDVEFLARFAREVQLAQRVPEFCTAPVRDEGLHAGRPYLITDYLDGVPLHQLIDDEGPLDPASLHNLAIGLAAGLTAIHDCELVHRDLKPSNVMVTRGGVRIIDFGIARALDTNTRYTRTGLVMGSLGWASPEQLDGFEPTPAMDVFGWGCLVAYAATGDHPFGGGDATSRSWRILHADPTLDGLSPLLRELVAAALDRRAEHRPAAQELLLVLVGGQPPATMAAGPIAGARPAAAPGGAASGGAASGGAGPGMARMNPPVARPPVPAARAGAGPGRPGSAPGAHSRRPRWMRRLKLLMASLPVAVLLVLVVASSLGDPFGLGDDGAGAADNGQVNSPSSAPGKRPPSTRAPGPGRPGDGQSTRLDPAAPPAAVSSGASTSASQSPQPGADGDTGDDGDDGDDGDEGDGNGNGNGRDKDEDKKPPKDPK